MIGERDPQRSVLEIRGSERESFLQGLVTQDVRRVSEGPLYAALLTPQGKYICDFFLISQGDAILLDVSATQAADLFRRLSMYRLRADVQITESALLVTRGPGPAPEGAVADPRHPAMGWRFYGSEAGGEPQIDWDALRVEHLIPEAGSELIANETYILEAGFERLGGVDFRKGCYVGQEVTARMKHKTELRKGFARAELSAPAAPGTALMQGEKEAGVLCTVSGTRAIAWLRFDRAEGEMQAGDVKAWRI